MKEKAVISMSGGMDSTCLALYLLSQGYEVKAYGFDYGQGQKVELKLAKKNVALLAKKGWPITYQVIDLRSAFDESASCLVTHEKAPSGDYKEETMKVTVVENRNVIFSSIIYGKALAWANKTNSSVVISMGVHAGDHTVYRDCQPESVNMARELFRISNWNSEKVDYETPFVFNTKGEVLKIGLAAMKKMGFRKPMIKKILKNTSSCYNVDGEGKACGTCGTCTERLEAFVDNGMQDPIPYANTGTVQK